MNSFIKSITVVALLLIVTFSFGQGEYFEVVCKKVNGTQNEYTGRLEPLNNQSSIVLEYKGKTKKQLMQAVIKYIQERKGFWIDKMQEEDGSYGAFITFGDFASIGDILKCKANLVSSTRMNIRFQNDGKLLLSEGSWIYASLFSNVQYRISRGGLVFSEGDTPFNDYKFIQPQSKNEQLAYPESIFDADGKLVNPTNKKIIEDFYDAYVIDLKNYLDKNLK
ncbi:hypothetical protein BWD42_07695 [Sphingobacterium sp. CZ-UAM]|uniref:hypothetical protein n=1 Tax=Sphingobacterium sp. CZ-UAM TaxID=1933868 RepID=UPI0009874218|nr:hypothetical protein [Sphingobacterium sp. CZ-UAM]OOG19774.1 hypothetical protein BWD42_07695 [Sphingobacterium sp. CZ-UAM]